MRAHLVSYCKSCKLRGQCLKTPEPTLAKTVSRFHATSKAGDDPAKMMRHAIDSPQGRRLYSQRIGTVEPVFGSIRRNKQQATSNKQQATSNKQQATSDSAGSRCGDATRSAPGGTCTGWCTTSRSWLGRDTGVDGHGRGKRALLNAQDGHPGLDRVQMAITDQTTSTRPHREIQCFNTHNDPARECTKRGFCLASLGQAIAFKCCLTTG